MTGLPTEPLTAVQVISNLDPGGAQEVVRTLARFLPDAGCRPIVVTLRDGSLRREIELLGVPVVVMQGRRHSVLALPFAIAEMLRIRRELRRVIRQYRASIVQTHLLRALDFLVFTLKFDGSVGQVYWTLHNARLDLRRDQVPGNRWLLQPKRIVHRMLYRAASRGIDGLVAVAAEVGESARKAYHPPAGKLVVIPNGVDLDRYGHATNGKSLRDDLSVPHKARILIVVAKLYVQKGHSVLLDSLKTILPNVPDLHVVIVGDGPEREYLAAASAAMPGGSRIHFMGSRSDVPDLLAASDLFVLPSLWEGLPIALLEAMASALPVVATDVSGSRDVVVDGESGLLVAPGDSRALAAAISRLLADSTWARAMGARARERVARHFSARMTAERHVAMYRAGSRLGVRKSA